MWEWQCREWGCRQTGDQGLQWEGPGKGMEDGPRPAPVPPEALQPTVPFKSTAHNFPNHRTSTVEGVEEGEEEEKLEEKEVSKTNSGGCDQLDIHSIGCNSTSQSELPEPPLAAGQLPKRPGMALSSRAQAFSVEALVGRTSKRKRQDPRKEAPPELQEKEDGKEEERSGTTGKKSKQPTEKRPKTESSATFSGCGGPAGGGGGNCGCEGGGGGGGCSGCGSGGDNHKGETLEEKDAIQVELQGSELWKRFHAIGTEMIITKAGRRMFPSVRVKVKGLDPGKQYYVVMDVVPVDSKRYRYVYHSSQWMVAGNTDHSCITPRLYVHPDSPCSGETWMRQIISFDRVKLTNNEMDDKDQIILQSMHKYKPRVHVMEQDSRANLSWIQSLPTEGVKTFSFEETEFTTVTAYQNQQITKLKIDRNPFAKGFRDPGRNKLEAQCTNSCMGGVPLGGLQGSGQNPQSNTACSSYLPLPLIPGPTVPAEGLRPSVSTAALASHEPCIWCPPKGSGLRIELKLAL
ncbi:T-box transcription factor TBX22 [Myotis davidii]|uniref:T-box transcription factor TBX22 n=1 Tax=Myotis davidii TaxID=225400 RepID=L5LMR8_MYODS|nr:T-box transcription factor TBX22 [Myotis davidii]